MPADTMNLEASSKDIFKYITSSTGNISKKPLVGFGVVGTKTLIKFFPVFSAISPLFSFVANPTAVGFATKENKGEMAEKTGKNLINVFVPTTPNPTSGFLLMFPVEDVIYLNMSFEEASKFIVSAGTSTKKS